MSEAPTQPLSVPLSANPLGHPPPSLTLLSAQRLQVQFEAMASPCEIHVELPQLNIQAVSSCLLEAVSEAWRIEYKYSRYQKDNIVDKINTANGATVSVDTETAGLLNYADQAFELSDGKFDITSGPLRRIWQFRPDAKPPSQQAIDEILALIGWQKCQWQGNRLTVPKGAEIDFGGIGKEYAVDKVCQLLSNLLVKDGQQKASVMVNFGGDIAANGPRMEGEPWLIGLQDVRCTDDKAGSIPLSGGGIATSGDTHRYILWQGKRLSHILNPKTGWPVFDAPQSVTVVAPSCTLAGMLSTFAMLNGKQAESFLKQQNYPHWIQRARP